MATHKFILAEGGYFHRYEPNIKEHPIQEPRSTIRRTLFEIQDDNRKQSKNNFYFLTGIFIYKQQEKKQYSITLQQSGRLLLFDDVTEQLDKTALESTLYITVDEQTYNYDWVVGMAYKITPDEIIELNPF